MTGTLTFGVLGPLTAGRDGAPVPLGPAREQALLAVLLLHPGVTLSGAALLDAVWGEEPPPTGQRVLPPYVYRLRRRLDETLLTRDGSGYRAEVRPDQLDLGMFERLAGEGRQARAAGDPDRAVALLGRAEALWRGEPLAGLPGPWLAAWRDRVAARLQVATEDRLGAELDRGRHADVVAELVALAGREPASESVAELLMLALHRCGRQADALAAFTALRAALAGRGAGEPGARLQAVQQAVLTADPALDAPVRAAPVAATGPAALPAPPAGFVGRDAELADLLTAAGAPAPGADPDGTTAGAGMGPTGGGPTVIAVDGMAGIGKTALAVAAAHRLAARFPGGALFVDLRGHTPGRPPTDPSDALDLLLRAVGVTQPLPADPDERAALWRASVRDRRLLLVLDNARTAAQVEPLLPAGPGCLVLVTGRHRLLGLQVTHTLSLGVLPDRDAAALLRGPDTDAAAAREVVRLCGGLPLALRLGAARLRRHPGWTLADLADRLRGHGDRLAELSTGDRSVRAAFALSYDQLGAAEQRTFRLLALAPGPDVDAYAAAALTGATPDDVAETLEQLLDANLLQQPRPGRFQLHDLLREYAAALLDPDAERAACERLLDFSVHVARDAGRGLSGAATPDPEVAAPAHRPSFASTQERLEWLDAEADALVAATALAAAGGWPAHAWQLAAAVTPYLVLRFRLDEAREVNRAGLDAAARLGDGRAEANLRMHRGHLHSAAGRVPEAVADYRAAAAYKRRTGDRRGEFLLVNNIATLEVTSGRYADALRHLRAALEMFDAEQDPSPVGYVQINLAEVFHRLGRHVEAVEAARTAARLLSAPGSDPRSRAYALVLDARALVRLDRPADAVPVLRDAVERGTTIDDHLIVSTALAFLGTALQQLGDATAALDSHRRARAEVDLTGLPEAEQIVVLEHADTLLRLGRPARARPLYDRALRLHDDVRDPHQRARALRGLAACADAAGQAARSAALHRQADAIAADLHPQTTAAV